MPFTDSASIIVPSGSGKSRPALVLVALDMGRDAPSETGKAWNWACALSRHWQLHVITTAATAESCRSEPSAAGWQWHPTTLPAPATFGWRYYRGYARWCREVSAVVQRVVATARPARLHHITLGSFRVFPRYERCGVPYSLGPLGGGETIPWNYLRTAALPWRPALAELMRARLNSGCAMLPWLRAVMSRAEFALATTPETERVLRQMGAQRTGVVFPDCVPVDVDHAMALPVAERTAGLAEGLRLIWSGRALWWKGGQIAIELMRRLAAANIKAELTIFSCGPALPDWQRQIVAAGVDAQCRLRGFLPRPELLRELGRAHAFVYPTLHDSSSSALLEAYALGLPSLTTGVGGPAVVATERTGYNVQAADLRAWLEGAVTRLRHWQQAPAAWIEASKAAVARADDFRSPYLEATIDRWLSPGTLSR